MSGEIEKTWESPQLRQLSAELSRDPATMAEAERIFGGATPQEMPKRAARVEPCRWPSPPDKKVFHGLAGDFVRAVEPYTEGDSVAILVQALIGFGNALNRRPHFCVESVKHYPNLYAVLVGATSKGRKGTSWGRAKELLSRCDSPWAANRIKGGLSSGEGLIWAVRDPITTHEAVREGRRVIDYQDVETDSGEIDKRLLVFEPEFALVLRQIEREGNTLSALIRQGWDSEELRIMTKKSAATATGAHISIIGHITVEELRRYLNATEQGNGFANRFLWICVARSKFLSEDADRTIRFGALDPIVEGFKQAIEHAATVGEMTRDETARSYWRAVYAELSKGKPGLLGAITSRAEAQVMRLAMIYALLACSSVIRGEHLEAALALWEFVERSCQCVFGNATGNPDADTILSALSTCLGGMNRTEISALFGRNVSASRITQALHELAALGLARQGYRQTGGRLAEVWEAI